MDSKGRKKFCLSKRVEEYHYMESESSDEASNDGEDYSAICKLFHQAALKRSKKMEIEKKIESEFQRQNPNFTNSFDQSTSSTNQADASDYEPNQSHQAYTSTPRITNALRPINKIALSRIETSQTLPNHHHTFRDVNRSTTYQQYQEPYTNMTNHHQKTDRKSIANFKRTTMPYERLRKLANDSPYLSLLTPNPVQAKRMKRRATMMSTFKTYCEINTQTTPLDQRDNSLMNNNNDHLNSHHSDKSDSSASVISFSRAFVDEPEDIYINHNNEPKIDIRLSDHHESSHHNSRATRSNSDRKSSDGSIAFSFDAFAQDDKRSRLIPPSLKSSKNSTKQSTRNFASHNSEVISEVPSSTQSKATIRGSKSLSSLPNATKQQSTRLQEEQSTTNRRMSRNKSEILSTMEDSSRSRKSSSTMKNSARKSSKNETFSKNPSIIYSVQDDSSVNESLRSRKSSSRLSSTPKQSSRTSSRISSSNESDQDSIEISYLSKNRSEIKSPETSQSSSKTPSSSLKKSTRNSSINIQVNNKSAIDSIDDQETNEEEEKSISHKNVSTKSKRRSTINNSKIIANDLNSEIVSNNKSKTRTTINTTDNSLKASVNSEIKTVNGSSDQDSSSSSTSDISLKLGENSEIQTVTDLTEQEEEESISDKNISTKSKRRSTIHNSEIIAIDLDSEIVSNNKSGTDTTINTSGKSLKPSANSEIKTVIDSSEQDSLSSISDISNKNSEIISNVNETENRSDESSEEINTDSDDHLRTKKDSAIVTHIDESSMKANSEIFSNHIAELNDSLDNTMSENKHDSIKSTTLPDLSDDYEVCETNITSHITENSDDRYSKIEDSEDDDESDSQKQDHKSIENEESSDEEMIVEFEERINEAASSSRIEPNCSKISVSFEPINNSVEDHLKSDNHSEIASEDDEPQQHDGEFKIPKRPPKKLTKSKPSTAPITKPQPKIYETFVNKTPTIIYPETAEEEEDDQDGSRRRSNRIRVKPFNFWSNQRLIYKQDTATKCFTIDGVDKGSKPDNPFSKKRTRLPTDTRKRKRKQKRSKLSKIKEERESDEDESSESSTESSEEDHAPAKKPKRSQMAEESIHVNLNESAIETSERIKRETEEYTSRQDLKWNKSKQSDGVYIALMNRKKSPKTGVQASGFIKLESLAEKPRQKSSDYITKYVIMFGVVSVQIGDQPNVFLKSTQSFVVGQHTMYSIRNLRNTEALLYFDVARVN